MISGFDEAVEREMTRSGVGRGEAIARVVKARPDLAEREMSAIDARREAEAPVAKGTPPAVTAVESFRDVVEKAVQDRVRELRHSGLAVDAAYRRALDADRDLRSLYWWAAQPSGRLPLAKAVSELAGAGMPAALVRKAFDLG